MFKVACTIIGEDTFGKICLKIIRKSLAPSALIASIYSSFLVSNVEPRTILAKTGMENTATAMITFCKLPPRTLTIAKANKIPGKAKRTRSEEHTSELQSRFDLVCRLLLEKKKKKKRKTITTN